MNIKAIRIISLGASLAAFGLAGTVLPAREIVNAQEPQPDNTAANKQQAPTAEQQKETAADRDLARKIRQSILKDKSLSTYAHNIKVIAHDGMVTLKGPVHSEDEKQVIGTKAGEIAGADKVDNQITIAP
jgi:hyperosmotically inducible periplasmic protein